MTRETLYGFDKIITQEEGNIIEIKLKLHKEKRSRLVGYIKTDLKTLYIKREKAKHLMRVNNSIGFNYALINDAKRFDKVMLMLDGKNYLIPNEFILQYVSFLHFKEVGFERQIFLKVNEFERFLQN